MKGLKTKPLIFYQYKTIVLLIAISFTIWLNLHTTVDPSSTLQWKEKKKKKKNLLCMLFCFCNTLSTVWNLLHPLALTHGK